LSVEVLDRHVVRVRGEQVLSAPSVFEYLVSDGVTSVAGELVVLVVGGSADEPPVTVDDAAVVREGDVVEVPVLANDADPEGGALKVVLGATVGEQFVGLGVGEDPAGVVFTDGLTVRFAALRAGAATVSYRAVDPAGNTQTGLLRLFVTPSGVGAAANRAPVAAPVEARALAGTEVTIRVPVVNADPDGDSVTLALGPPTVGARGVARVGEGCFCFVYSAPVGQFGTDTFTYVLRDSFGATGVGQVRVGVVPAVGNEAPVGRADRVRVRPGRSLSVDVLSNDSDPDGDDIALVSITAVGERSGVSARVAGGEVEISAGDSEGVASFSYTIRDSRGLSGIATLSVEVSGEAEAFAPVAVDDGPQVCEAAGSGVVTCDVLANDSDPDEPGRRIGRDAKLTVAAGVSVSPRGSKLRVTLTAAARNIVYRIEDRDGLAAFAVLRVNGTTTNLAPRVKAKPPAVNLVVGEKNVLKIGDFAEDPEGKAVFIGNEAIGFPLGDSGSAVAVSPTEFALTATRAGTSAVQVEVTDGTDAVDPGGVRATITINVTARSATNTAPVFAPATIDVGRGETGNGVDLRAYVTDPDPGDRAKTTFTTLAALPAGWNADITDDHVLRVSAAESLSVGASATLRVGVSDSRDTSEGNVTVRVVGSTKPPVVAVLDVIEAKAGETKRVDLVANDAADASLKPLVLKPGSVTLPADAATTTVTENQADIKVDAGFKGTATGRYTVIDTAGREATGELRLVVKAVPDPPAAPTELAVGDRYVELGWQAPTNNGGTSITSYEVRDAATGTTLAEQQGQTTRTRVTGLTNGTTYRFEIVAINAQGPSKPSPASAPITPNAIPAAPPTPPTLTWKGASGQLEATWNAYDTPNWPANGIRLDHYELETTPATTTVTVPAGTTTATLTGLDNTHDYTVQIRAVATHGPGPLSTPSNKESSAAPPAQVEQPTAVREDSPLGEYMIVTWKQPATNSTQCCTYTINPESDMDQMWGPREPVAVPASSTATVSQRVSAGYLHDFHHGENSVAYQFSVVAHNKAGNSPASPLSTPAPQFVPPDDGFLDLPARATGVSGHVEVQMGGMNSFFTGGRPIEFILLNITAAGGGAGTGKRWVPVSDFVNSWATISGLTDGTEYAFTGQRCNNGRDERYCASPTPSVNVVPYVQQLVDISIPYGSYDFADVRVSMSCDTTTATSQWIQSIGGQFQAGEGERCTFRVEEARTADDSASVPVKASAATMTIAGGASHRMEVALPFDFTWVPTTIRFTTEDGGAIEAGASVITSARFGADDNYVYSVPSGSNTALVTITAPNMAGTCWGMSLEGSRYRMDGCVRTPESGVVEVALKPR
jgi:hypothetical protein